MGYIKHNAVVITGWKSEDIKAVHKKAKEIFNHHFNSPMNAKDAGTRLVSELISGVVNSQLSFFIAPDGSKEGWGDSDHGDAARKELIEYIKSQDIYCDYIDVMFGGDNDLEAIVQSNSKSHPVK